MAEQYFQKQRSKNSLEWLSVLISLSLGLPIVKTGSYVDALPFNLVLEQ